MGRYYVGSRRQGQIGVKTKGVKVNGHQLPPDFYPVVMDTRNPGNNSVSFQLTCVRAVVVLSVRLLSLPMIHSVPVCHVCRP